MALKDYSSGNVSKWVTIGGKDREGNKNPDKVEGYYLGRTEAPSTFEPGKLKITYNIRTAQGVIGVNGSANMNIKMTDSETNLQNAGETALNSFVSIKFVGTKPSKKGSPTKLYEVMFDADNKLDASDASSLNDDEPADLDEVFGSDDDEIDAPPAVTTAASAERKAKVDALLNRKSAKRNV